MYHKYRKEKAGKNDSWNKVFCSTCIGITNDIGICTQSYSFNEWAHLCSTKGTVQTNTENRKEMTLLTFALGNRKEMTLLTFALGTFSVNFLSVTYLTRTFTTLASHVRHSLQMPLPSGLIKFCHFCLRWYPKQR